MLRRFGMRRLAVAGIAASGLLAFALRLPFVWTGIGPDEGGYAYVADRWAHGDQLYHMAWVDRPQGLLLVYRGLIGIAHAAWAIRLGAVLFGCGIAVLLGVIGWLLRGPALGLASSAIYAVAGVAPRLEGFTFNAELAASLPATAAVASSLAWLRSRRRGWLVAAGALGGTALLMKQSGLDGLVVAVVIALAAGTHWRERLRDVGLVALGAAVPLAASAVHGAIIGWHDYWFAVAGYKLNAASGASGDFGLRLKHFQEAFPQVRLDLWGLLLVALVGLVLTIVARPRLWLPVVWLLAAFVGFNLAALYWGHYYVQLLPPLCLLAGVAVTQTPWRILRPLLAALAVGPVAFFLVHLLTISQEGREHAIKYYRAYETDVAIAHDLARRTKPDEPVYVLSSRADIYFIARRRSAFRYNWGHGIHEVAGAMASLQALLASGGRPRWVVEYTNAHHVDHSGRLASDLSTYYCRVKTYPGTHIRLYRRCH